MTTSMQLSPAGVLVEAFRRLKKDFFRSYRPELHYMRGPGPRWHQKHALRLAQVAAASIRRRRFPAVRPVTPFYPGLPGEQLAGEAISVVMPDLQRVSFAENPRSLASCSTDGSPSVAAQGKSKNRALRGVGDGP